RPTHPGPTVHAPRHPTPPPAPLLPARPRRRPGVRVRPDGLRRGFPHRRRRRDGTDPHLPRAHRPPPGRCRPGAARHRQDHRLAGPHRGLRRLRRRVRRVFRRYRPAGPLHRAGRFDGPRRAGRDRSHRARRGPQRHPRLPTDVGAPPMHTATTRTPAAGRASPPAWRIIAAASIGNALEWFDLVVYGFFAVTISRLFFPSDNDSISLLLTLGTFGVSFFMRPLGALVLGVYADRVGRRATLTLSIVLMMLGTLLIAVMPTYDAIGIW